MPGSAWKPRATATQNGEAVIEHNSCCCCYLLTRVLLPPYSEGMNGGTNEKCGLYKKSVVSLCVLNEWCAGEGVVNNALRAILPEKGCLGVRVCIEWCDGKGLVNNAYLCVWKRKQGFLANLYASKWKNMKLKWIFHRLSKSKTFSDSYEQYVTSHNKRYLRP